MSAMNIKKFIAWVYVMERQGGENGIRIDWCSR